MSTGWGSLSKTIRLPSGDHCGAQSGAVLWVNWTTPVPSVFITKISKSPSRSLSKTIRVPSGDQDAFHSW